MSQKKLLRFAELETFSNVLQYPANMQGRWNEFFENDNPVLLELACGKGEYAIGLAEQYPDNNFVGVDQKGNRLWVGAKKARMSSLKNVAFLRIQIDRITEFFASGEIEEIWITFPDPQLRISKSKKRLTHPKFLRLYNQLLKPGGRIHLKTDSPDLYLFTKKVIDMYGCILHQDLDDVYGASNLPKELQIKTYYESLDIAKSNRIHYLCFSLPNTLASKEMDAVLHECLKKDAGLAIDKISPPSPPSSEWKPKKLFEDDEYYFNEKGLVTFTSEYLLARGYCCGNGCRNCPYDYKAVPEPRRSHLLAERKNHN